MVNLASFHYSIKYTVELLITGKEILKVENKNYQLLHTNSCLVCMKVIFFISRWIVNVKHILDFAGFSYI